MMKISIYDVYKVESNYVGSYYGEDSYRDLDGLHADILEERSKDCRVMGGGELMEVISRSLADKDIDEITFDENAIHISFFDPMTGLSSEISWKIVKVEKQ